MYVSHWEIKNCLNYSSQREREWGKKHEEVEKGSEMKLKKQWTAVRNKIKCCVYSQWDKNKFYEAR